MEDKEFRRLRRSHSLHDFIVNSSISCLKWLAVGSIIYESINQIDNGSFIMAFAGVAVCCGADEFRNYYYRNRDYF